MQEIENSNLTSKLKVGSKRELLRVQEVHECEKLWKDVLRVQL